MPASLKIFHLFFTIEKITPFIPSYLFQHLIRLSLLIILAISALGFGLEITKKINPSSLNLKTTNKLLFSLGFGFSAIILLMFIIAITGILYKSIALGILCVGFLLAVKNFITHKRPPDLHIKDSNTKSLSLLEKIFIFIIIFSVVPIFISTLAPETFYDSLIAHLGIPLKWIQEHRLFSIPFNSVSDMPVNIHLIYTIGLMLYDEVLVKLIHFMFFILTGYSVYSICKNYLNKSTGIFATLIFTSTPLIMFIAARSGIEMGLAFFEVLSVLAILNWINNRDKKWFYIAGIMNGISVGGKYTSIAGLISMSVAIFGYLFIIEKNNFRKCIKHASIFALISLLTASPWFIKNIINWGNPFVPLLKSLAISDTDRLLQVVDPPKVTWTLKKLILFPWYWTTGVLQMESKPGLLYIFIAPIILFTKNLKKEIKLLGIYIIPYVIIALTLGRAYMRYSLPMAPIICIILAAYVINISDKTIKQIFTIFAIPLIIMNISTGMIFLQTNVNPANVVFGFESKESYLSTMRPTHPYPYYKAAKWINTNTPKDAKILEIGETRNFYIQRKTINNNIYFMTPIVEFTKQSKSAQELATLLKNKGITHILLNTAEAMRLKGLDPLYWNSQELTIFSEFFDKHTKEVYKFLPDVQIQYGQRISDDKNSKRWKNYSKSLINYIYVYEISEAPIPNNPPKINILQSKYVYSEKRRKILNIPE
ncbi:ArnT family glycosyltransferase [bacterium]